MTKKHILKLLTYLLVALVSFGGGVAYVVCGAPIPRTIQELLSPRTEPVFGTVVSQTSLSITLQLEDGTVREFPLNPLVQLEEVLPLRPSREGLELGWRVQAYLSDGRIIYIRHEIEQGPPISTPDHSLF